MHANETDLAAGPDGALSWDQGPIVDVHSSRSIGCMKLFYLILIFTTVLAGCAGVDPSAADRERNREMTGLLLLNCPLSHFAPPDAPVLSRCPT